MSHYFVQKSTLKGEIRIPSSKSHTLRAILFALLGNGKSSITNYLPSKDTLSMIEACRLFGASIEVFPTHLIIEGTNGIIPFCEDIIHAGNSGIILRFCSAIGALSSNPVVITGDYSIRHQRPMKPLLKALEQLNVSTTSLRGDGYAPVIIQGPLKPGETTLSGEDSQPVSALLIAAAFAQGTTDIHVTNPGEKPWVALTLDWLKRLSIPYENHNFQHYRLFGNSKYPGFHYAVPGDLSSAAFPIAAALITQSEITLHNVDLTDCQGDKKLLEIFEQMGALFEIDPDKKTLCVKKTTLLQGVRVDLNDCIDAITILAVVACFAEGETRIYNAAIAKQKECNRIHCIATELQKMGAHIVETEDGLIIQKSSLQGAHLDSHKDHRMAMSLTVSALGALSPSTISSTDCIEKTFPLFLQDFNKLGAQITSQQTASKQDNYLIVK